MNMCKCGHENEIMKCIVVTINVLLKNIFIVHCDNWLGLPLAQEVGTRLRATISQTHCTEVLQQCADLFVYLNDKPPSG